MDIFATTNYTFQAFIAALLTCILTSVGSSVVLFFKNINKDFMDKLLGLSAGVMLAASFWSLLNPAIEMAESLKMIPWIIVGSGILMGAMLLIVGNKLFDLCMWSRKNKDNSSLKRCLMLVFSITLHNIPEGLAIGVSFGSILYGIEGATTIAAWMLALGIGIQNLPEGAAVSLPLIREGYSKKKAFMWGAFSGLVEPIAAVIGALLVLNVRNLLPFLLSFAAGAMIYVVIEELIPTSQQNNRKEVITLFTIIGFVIMMILDITLG